MLPGFPAFDCAGQFAGRCVSSLTTAVNPELRTRFRMGWETPWNVDLALTHRYISAVEQQGAAANRIDRHARCGELLRPVRQLERHGDGAACAWASTTCSTTIRRSTPSVGKTGNGNTFPQVYDALGRFIFGGVTVKF